MLAAIAGLIVARLDRGGVMKDTPNRSPTSVTQDTPSQRPTTVPEDAPRAPLGGVLFHLDGASATYTDTTGTGRLASAPTYSNRGRAFGPRLTQAPPLRPTGDGLAGKFPYGVYGINETDSGTIGDYNDGQYDVDPVDLIEDVATDGVYNIAVSTRLGSINVDAKIIRTLQAAKARGLKLIVRAIEFTPGGNHPLNVPATEENLLRFGRIFTLRPDLKPVVYAWYSYDEPLVKHVSLHALQATYALHKRYYPDIPVFTVFNQNQSLQDGPDPDKIGDGFLGQPLNPYGPGVADIVGLNVYNAVSDVVNPNYGYGAISRYYTSAREVVSRVDQGTPIWAVAQAHGILRASNPLAARNMPEPHQLYRQVNDWLRAGPESEMPPVDGWLWYSWHFRPDSPQTVGDLEGNPANRAMAVLIGRQLAARRVVTHDLPYREELCVGSGPALRDCSAGRISVPAAGHISPTAGTITFAFTHTWPGDDGVDHVLIDTGVDATKDRLTIRKTAGNTLRLAVTDAAGRQKWTELVVNKENMPGRSSLPGYSDIAATWDGEGNLGLWLDGVSSAVSGGTSGTGKLAAVGRSLHIGTDLTGNTATAADGTFSYLTIRNVAGTPVDISAWTRDAHLAYAPTAPALASPAPGARASSRTPTFTWGAVENAVRYDLMISNATGTVTRTVTVTGVGYTTSPALRPGTYSWKVRAVDNYGVGNYSATRAVIVK